ncbi:MAG: response regulator transcription factor [Elusimicrobiota bacterium]
MSIEADGPRGRDMGVTVLIIEDDLDEAARIKEILSPGGYSFIHVSTCAEGWRYLREFRPSLVILDVCLPDGSGLSLCQKIRADPELASTPVIMLTAMAMMRDMEKGFGAGADQYLLKLTQMDELPMWAAALLRRAGMDESKSGVLRSDDFVMDPQTFTVRTGGRVIGDLTRKEFDLLYELVRNRPKVFSKQFILSKLWHTVLRDNTVEVHIRNLRAKLGDARKRIVTVSKVGYKFE